MGRSTRQYASKGSERVWQGLAHVEDTQDVLGCRGVREVRSGGPGCIKMRQGACRTGLGTSRWGREGHGQGRWHLVDVWVASGAVAVRQDTLGSCKLDNL